MSKVIDLSDLVKAIEFSFSGKNFNIPPIPDDKLTGIMSTAAKITKMSEDKGGEASAMNEEFLKNQNHFLALSIQKKEDDQFVKMEEAEFATWPMKLKNRVMELVFEQIGTSSGENVDEGQEKN